MSLKSLLITIFFAVCIDRSFESAQVIKCDTAKECLDIVKEKLTQVPLPILLTKNEKKFISVDKAILRFFEDKPYISKILQVNVQKGSNTEMVRHFHRQHKKQKLSYPFVSALSNNRVICHLAYGFDLEALEKIYEAAVNPTENDFVPRYTFFTADMETKVNKVIEFYKGKNLGQTSKTSESQDPEGVVMIRTRRDSAGATNLITSPHDQSNLPTDIIAEETSKRQLSTDLPLPPKKRLYYRMCPSP